MIEIDVLTLFPEMIEGALSYGVLSHALDKSLLRVKTTNPRTFAEDKHKSVDDRPFGGGDGMVMLPEVLRKTMDSVKRPNSQVIYLSPQGKPLNSNMAKSLSEADHLILICGRYGGIDQRFISQYVDEELSIGDFVLSGGELAACVVIESLSRFLPGALGHGQSSEKDSFTDGLLEAPQYTRPREWSENKVPGVLTNGNHAEIESWKKNMSWLVTLQKRPDLFEVAKGKLPSNTSLMKDLEAFYKELTPEDLISAGLPQDLFQRKNPKLAVGLMHYPILDRKKNIVSTNITNFDIHDIARASRVYGVEKYYILHPMREQLMFVERVLDHWKTGIGSRFNPMRKTALVNVRAMESVSQAIVDWGVKSCRVIATSAREVPGVKRYTFNEFRQELKSNPEQAYLIVFGTGFGFTEEFLKSCDGVLEGIQGASVDNYRHLSVRSAVSICLDRLLAPDR